MPRNGNHSKGSRRYQAHQEMLSRQSLEALREEIRRLQAERRREDDEFYLDWIDADEGIGQDNC